MPQLRLLPIDAEMADLLSADGQAFEERFRITIGGAAEFLREVVVQTVEFVRRVPRDPLWGGYLSIDQSRRSVVGMGGYKGAPTADGEIEIAYGTLPAFEGQGYATALAAELTRRAFADDRVKRVIAHTLPERNASARLLEKNGFRFVGEVIDPEDGLVWRWTREREA
jgi:RimJ/RimL family protein N-acetyltransferase